MKCRITLKDPDGVYEGVRDSVNYNLEKLNLDKDEREAVAEVQQEKLEKLLKTWFMYGEYVTLEVDTDLKTCIVVPQSK